MARLRRGGGLLATLALALALWLVWGHGFANYDALYSLVWGDQLSRGASPSYEVFLAPTPHPLANLVGLILSPLAPRDAERVLVVIAFLALGAVGWLIFRLGRRWFGWPAGALAAAIFLTREPVLSYGSRAYVDVPYLALVLGALLAVARRPAEGRAPLALLAVAGLIRPEAWLFSLALLAWLWRRHGWRWDLAVLAVSGPVLWLASDWAVTGDPLSSLTGTRAKVETLGRVTGLEHVPVTVPRRVGEVLREPVLVGAVGGVVLTLWRLRSRAVAPVAAGVLAVAAYVALAAAGLPIITRYAFPTSAILAIFCGAGAFGWLVLAREDRARLPWMAFAVLTVALLAAFVPSQAHRLDRTRTALAAQQRIEGDLWTLRLPPPCGSGLAVVNHRLVPLLALREDVGPGSIHPQPLPRSYLGTYVGPANAFVAKQFVLDPRDPSQRVPGPPPGLVPDGGNRSWRVLRKCAPDVVVHGGE